MKNQNPIRSILISMSLSICLLACGQQATKNESHHTEAHKNETAQDVVQNEDSIPTTLVKKSTDITSLINTYLDLKDALVNDNQSKAAEEAVTLKSIVKSFPVSTYSKAEQEKVENLLKAIHEQGNNIVSDDIAQQRKYFEKMGVNFKDLISIVGIDRTLYEQYCPMYQKGAGGMWYSASDEIRNPLYGSEMLICGRVREAMMIE